MRGSILARQANIVSFEDARAAHDAARMRGSKANKAAKTTKSPAKQRNRNARSASSREGLADAEPTQPKRQRPKGDMCGFRDNGMVRAFSDAELRNLEQPDEPSGARRTKRTKRAEARRADDPSKAPARSRAGSAAEAPAKGRTAAANRSTAAGKRERRKQERAKARADKMFAKQFQDAGQDFGADEGAPRAALYEGQMGSVHRKSARMQLASQATPQAAKLNPAGWLSNVRVSPKTLRVMTAALCLVLFAVFLYTPAQQYYQAQREHDKLAAEYAVLEQRNETLDSQNDALSSNAGMEDAVRQRYGYIKDGDQTAIVTGLSEATTDTSRDSEDIEANVLSSAVKAPEEWYTPYLDAFFGVS